EENATWEAEGTAIHAENILSPTTGEIVPLTSVEDEVFSSETMGQGVAIRPDEGRMYAPVDGTVTSLFRTKHAVGITSDNGAEILIHIGMDTVQLDGEFFETHISQGDIVKAGDLLVEFDIDKITEAGDSIVTPIITTNTSAYEELEIVSGDTIVTKEVLIITKYENKLIIARRNCYWKIIKDFPRDVYGAARWLPMRWKAPISRRARYG